MTYPPQPPMPHGQYPQQQPQYGQYPQPPGHPPMQNPYGGYGMPPGPPRKSKAGPVVAITVTALVVVALLITAFAWPGWLLGDDEPATTPLGSLPTTAASDPNSSRAVAEAVVAKLNNKDVEGIARELACSGLKKQSKSGKGTNLEIDVYNAAPSLDRNNGSKVQEIKTEFRLIEVRPTKPGDIRYNPKYKDDHVAKIAVKFYDVPEPVKDQLKDGTGEITLIRENSQWRFCGVEIAGDGRGDDGNPGSSGSGGAPSADPADPDSVANAWVAAINSGDQAGAEALTCPTGTTVKSITAELIKVGGKLTLDRPVTSLGEQSTNAPMQLTGTAQGDTAKLIGSLNRQAPNAPWCVNFINIAK